MAVNEIHVGDVGTIFEVILYQNGVVAPLGDTTVRTFKFRKPSGTVVQKTASFATNGSDGALRYTAAAGDLDEVGEWELQAYVEMPTGKWNSDIQSFKVSLNIG